MDDSTFDLMFNNMDTKNDYFDTLTSHASQIHDATSKSAALKDAYGNSLLSIGTDDKSASFDTTSYSNDTLNWPLWLALYNDSWVVKRAIDKPAQDEIRAGITIFNVNDADKLDTLQRILKSHRSDFIELLQWGHLFGGAIACMLFDTLDDADYAKPMNYAKIKKSTTMKMYVVDRWYGVAPDYSVLVNNMGDIDFGKPMYYDITFADGRTLKVHHDYVLRYEGRMAPKLVKNGMLQGWGYSDLAHIFNELMRDEKLKSSIQSLIDKSLIEVIKMSGMRGVFMGADSDNENQLRRRLEMVNWGRNFNSLTFLDKDDDYQMNSFSGISGLADLLQQNMWLISSALEMQGVLFGDLRGGFSSDEAALERYSDTINARCETYVRNVYVKFLSIYYKILDIHEKVDFSFNDVAADIQREKRVDSLAKYVDLLKSLLDVGVIDTKKFAVLLSSYAKSGNSDIDFTDEELNKLDEDFELSSESIDE